MNATTRTIGHGTLAIALAALVAGACGSVGPHGQRAGTGAGAGGSGGGAVFAGSGGTAGGSGGGAVVSGGGGGAAAPRDGGAGAAGTRAPDGAAPATMADAGSPARLDGRAADVAPAAGGADAGPAGAPSAFFDLRNWKLTIPGPKELDPPVLTAGYTSKYFVADTAARTMIFWVDAAEKGSTPGSDYVRSELREQIVPGDDNSNWTLAGTHVMTARVRLKSSTLSPNKITVLQIHGYGDGVPPLLRVAIENGTTLNAFIKTNASGTNDQKVMLAPVSVGTFFDCEVRVQDGKLSVSVNGATPVMGRDVSFWKQTNYFKAGAYPQATSGVVQVEFEKLTHMHN